jgi:tripartite ATP-independent transporter DctP family solute receptor
MKKTGVVVCMLALVASLAWANGSQEKKASTGKETYTLMFSHALTENDPYHKAFLEWADTVKTRTNGGLVIDVYANSQLGAEEDVIEQMRSGANIGHNTDSARLGNYVPQIAVFNGPYCLESIEDVKKAMEAPSVKAWEKELEEKFGLKVLSFAYVQGYRNVISNKAVYEPSDLAGMKLRTAGAPIWQESVRAIGATPVSLSRSEIYSAAQTKAIDGIEDVYTAYANAQLNEVLKVVSETHHIYLVNFSVCSAAWFNSLPVEYQTILVEEADKAGFKVSRSIQENTEKIKAELIQKGVKVIDSSEIDLPAFKKAGEKAYEVLGILDAKKTLYKEIGK